MQAGFLAPTCFPQRQDEREWASAAAGRLKSRGQEELWFCHNCISSKVKTGGCFGIPLEVLKERDRLLPMLTLNRIWCDKGNSFVLEISCVVWMEGWESRFEAQIPSTSFLYADQPSGCRLIPATGKATRPSGFCYDIHRFPASEFFIPLFYSQLCPSTLHS